jgi:hypothetical protein
VSAIQAVSEAGAAAAKQEVERVSAEFEAVKEKAAQEAMEMQARMLQQQEDQKVVVHKLLTSLGSPQATSEAEKRASEAEQKAADLSERNHELAQRAEAQARELAAAKQAQRLVEEGALDSDNKARMSDKVSADGLEHSIDEIERSSDELKDCTHEHTDATTDAVLGMLDAQRTNGEGAERQMRNELGARGFEVHAELAEHESFLDELIQATREETDAVLAERTDR